VTIPVQTGIDAIAGGTDRLLADVDGLDDRGVARPSLLPGWTVAHVLTHLCRNADGNRRMLHGAAGGEVLDQYPGGVEGRAADIEAGVARPAADVLEDLRASSAQLAEALAGMPGEAWERPVRTLRGEMPARRILGSRRREVEMHHVDLGLGYGPGDWPADLVTDELDQAIAGLSERLPAATTLRLVATDRGRAWEAGVGASPVTVSGPAAWLLAWLVGRPVTDGALGAIGALGAPAGLPPLGPWG